MKKSSDMILLALAKFGQIVDNHIETYNRGLSKVMKIFTFLTVSFLPQSVIGSLFGMNVKVPYKYSDSLTAFTGIVALSFFFSFLAFSYFRYLKYI